MQNNAAVANEINMILVSLLKNRTKVITPNNKKIGSVTPNKEFSINLGSKQNNVAAITEYDLLKNFLPK